LRNVITASKNVKEFFMSGKNLLNCEANLKNPLRGVIDL